MSGNNHNYDRIFAFVVINNLLV